MLDVLFEQLIFKVGVLDGAAGDVVERQNTDQFLSIDDRYMGDMQRGHEAAENQQHRRPWQRPGSFSSPHRKWW